jgi:ABC-type enterobactin transport system permease subunit
MRFAWLRKNAADQKSVKQSAANQLTVTIYNLVWWVPIVLSIAKIIDYGAGFIAFTAITAIRLSANLYRNNTLTLKQAERFPFRAP